MTRVLIISNMYPSKDKPYAGIFVKNQVERLSEMGSPDLSVEAFVMRRKFTGAMGSVAKYLGAAVRFVPKLIRRYDVVHVHFFSPLYYVAWIYALLHSRAMLIVTFHGRDVSKDLSRSTRKWLARRAIRRADCLIAVGKGLASQVHSVLGRPVDLVLAAGVDRRVFFREPNKVQRYDYIYIGSFADRKGIDILTRLLEKGVRGRYCFVGSGPMKHDIEAAARKGGVVVDIVENLRQDEIRSLINASRFLLFPSREEGFGLAATEALYCGTPAIVSAVGGLAEQVVDGVNGIQIRDLSESGIREILHRAESISDDEYRRMSIAAETSNPEAALDFVCMRLLEVYRSRGRVAA